MLYDCHLRQANTHVPLLMICHPAEMTIFCFLLLPEEVEEGILVVEGEETQVVCALLVLRVFQQRYQVDLQVGLVQVMTAC